MEFASASISFPILNYLHMWRVDCSESIWYGLAKSWGYRLGAQRIILYEASSHSLAPHYPSHAEQDHVAVARINSYGRKGSALLRRKCWKLKRSRPAPSRRKLRRNAAEVRRYVRAFKCALTRGAQGDDAACATVGRTRFRAIRVHGGQFK